jgi:tetratricopeptide (TPR) repeat protein
MLLLLPVLPWALPLSREATPDPAGTPPASAKREKGSGRAGKRRARRKKARTRSRPERSSPWLDRAVSSILVLTPYALTLIVYFYYRSQALTTKLTAIRGAGGPSAALRDLFTSLAWYLKKMIWPEPLSAFVAGVPGGWWTTGLGVLGSVLAAWAFIIFVRRGFGREAVCLAIFFVFLLPPLGIVFKRVSETVLAERYLYLPTVGGCLLLAFLLARLGAWLSRTRFDRRVAFGLALAPAVLLGAFWTASVMARIPDWADDLTFWGDTAEKAPDHGLPHLHYGMALSDELENAYAEAFTLRRGKDRGATPPTPDDLSRAEELERQGAELDARAEAEYWRAWETYDDFEGRYLTGNNMGNLYQSRAGRALYRVRSAEGVERDRLLRESQDNYDLAIEQFTWSLANNPRYHKAYYNWARSETSLSHLARYRGDVQDYTRHLEAVVPRYEAAIARNPRYFKAFRALAEFLYQRGLYAEAADQHDLAARWARTPAERQRALAGAAQARQRLAEGPDSPLGWAREIFAEAERKRRAGRLIDATRGYWRALRLAPDLGRVYASWGELYAAQIVGERERGRADRVLECLHRADTLSRTAVEKTPNDPVVRLVRARVLLQAGLPEEVLEQVERLQAFPSLAPSFARQARDLQQRAASLDGSLPPGRAARAAFFLREGDAAVRQGRYAEAMSFYWNANRRGSGEGATGLRIGRLLRRTAGGQEQQGEHHAARELHQLAAHHYARAAKASPGSFEAESGAGESYLAAGKLIQATRHLAAAVPLAADGEARARVARLYEEAAAEVNRYLPE